jgi:hypothetical protein
MLVISSIHYIMSDLNNNQAHAARLLSLDFCPASKTPISDGGKLPQLNVRCRQGHQYRVALHQSIIMI